MTKPTTDAAEARARLDKLDTRDVHTGYDEGGNFVYEDYVRLADVRELLATAEAASGAGERQPMVAMGAALAAAISLLERGGKKAAPSDKMFEQMLRYYRRALDNGRAAIAAAPTIPATGEAGALAKMTALDEEIEAQHPGWMTGQAIPEGMKAWLGGDAPPDDWDGGRVLFRNGSMVHGCDVASWQHPWAKNVDEEPSMPSATTPFDIIAYTPKPTIPATGHAATEGEGA